MTVDELRIKNMNSYTLYASGKITDEGVKNMNLHTLDIVSNAKITYETIINMNLQNLYANKKMTNRYFNTKKLKII